MYMLYDSAGWFEVGEDSFMRQSLAWQTMSRMGVDTLLVYQAQVTPSHSSESNTVK